MIFYAKGQRKMKISKKWIQLCNIVCAVLMLALLVCQFLPFWTMPACNCTGECEKLNVNKDCPACSSYFKWCVNLPEEHHTVGVERRDYSKEWQVSIQEFVWTPTFDNCDGVLEHFDKLYSTDDYEFMLKDLAGMPVLVLFGALIGAYLCIVKSKNSLCSIIPLVTGISGITTYLNQPIFHDGAMWQLHLAIAIAITAFAVLPTLEYITRAINWLNPKNS